MNDSPPADPVLETRTLPAGSHINVGGIPLRILSEARVETHAANWLLIERDSVPQPNG
jgi:hypothetical protein